MDDVITILFGIISIILIVLINKTSDWKIKKESENYLFIEKVIWILSFFDFILFITIFLR